MKINQVEIKYAIDKAREISEYHKQKYLGGDSITRSVDDLSEICNEYLQKKINCLEHPLSSEGSLVKGFFVAYDDYYEIVLLSGQNFCWSRLVKTKELFHVIMDKEDYRNPSVAELINEVTVSFPDHDAKPETYAVSEVLTEIAAMEYLLPYSERIAIIANLKKAENINFLDIAERYKVPRLLIEKYLSAQWMEVLKPYCT